MTGGMQKTGCEFPVCDYGDTDYEAFWSEHDRQYEDLVERIALRRLTGDFDGTCLEIGGGYGRLTGEFAPLCTHVLLTDYAEKMLREARRHMKREGHDNVTCQRANLYELEEIGEEFDHAVCVRVLHHVACVPAFFEQVNHVLRPGGTFVFEYANKKNVLECARYLLRRANIAPFDYAPSLRKANIYYNFHPDYIRDILQNCGFAVEEQLSVSLFRNDRLKRLFGARCLAALERPLQKPLGRFHPGPSVFVRARKIADSG